MPEQAKTKAKKDRQLRFLMCQIIAALVAVLCVFALKLIGGEPYERTKAFFAQHFDTPINTNQVLSGETAQLIVAAQATVYGVGGESEDGSVPHYLRQDDISSEDKGSIKGAQVNTMSRPVSGRVTCKFGYRIHPISGKYSFHTGVDIGADNGSSIVSVMDGVVKKTVKNDADYGNYIIVTHSDGVETMYAHCSRLKAKAGERVTRGQCIALVGSTGLSTGPHLHFEIRVNDKRLNPEWFIKL